MMSTRDDDGAGRASIPREAQGQAAVLLVESLIHCLVERKVLTVADAIGVISTAMEVQAEVAEAADGAGAKMWQSYSLLASMAESLKSDLGAPD